MVKFRYKEKGINKLKQKGEWAMKFIIKLNEGLYINEDLDKTNNLQEAKVYSDENEAELDLYRIEDMYIHDVPEEEQGDYEIEIKVVTLSI